jgi:glycosyltransferase involved in cell wall biosynthesis
MSDKPMKKILMVTTVPVTLRSFLFPFIQHFRDQGWLVDGMACGILDDAKCVEAFDHVWDVELSRNPLDPRNFLRAPDTIRQIVIQGQYDIVHVHTPVAALVTRYALNGLRKNNQVKVIYTAHGFHFHIGGNPFTNQIFRTMEKLAGAWTDYLIVINHEDQAAAHRYNFLPTERIRYMPGIGVNTSSYDRQQVSEADIDRVRQELDISPNNPLLLAVAEFTPNKRHKDMIQALAKLQRPDVHLAFAGEGPPEFLAEIKQLINELKVNEQIHFLGFRNDIPTLICASTAVLLTSKREGLPRSIMEALCLETPVIGTAIRGISDLLADECGLLVKVGDIQALSDAMAQILDHPTLAQAMGKRGKQRMSDYDLKNILDLHVKLYKEALKN